MQKLVKGVRGQLPGSPSNSTLVTAIDRRGSPSPVQSAQSKQATCKEQQRQQEQLNDIAQELHKIIPTSLSGPCLQQWHWYQTLYPAWAPRPWSDPRPGISLVHVHHSGDRPSHVTFLSTACDWPL